MDNPFQSFQSTETLRLGNDSDKEGMAGSSEKAGLDIDIYNNRLAKLINKSTIKRVKAILTKEIQPKYSSGKDCSSSPIKQLIDF